MKCEGRQQTKSLAYQQGLSVFVEIILIFCVNSFAPQQKTDFHACMSIIGISMRAKGNSGIANSV